MVRNRLSLQREPFTEWEPSDAQQILAAAIIAATFCMASAPVHAEISWLDLLQDPDNAALNQQFVAERLAEGDLPAALSAVERLIILRPTDVPLRLLRLKFLSISRMTRWRSASWRH